MNMRWKAGMAALLLMMAGPAALADATIELTGDGAKITGTGASFAAGELAITEAGTYTISGTLEGQIAVYAGKNSAVTLELAGVDINNPNGAAIDAVKTGMLTISLAAGTENRLQSGESMPETSDKEAESIACISTKDDLVIAGEGAMTVLGYLGGGIKASNRLTIDGGAIDVTAARIGIKGKDSVTINGGEIAIESCHDGIQADADDGEGYGVVNIAGGVVSITSGGDAVQAETQLNVTGGEIVAVTGGGSENATGTHDDDFMMGMGGRGFGGGSRSGRGGMRRGQTATDGEAQADFDGFEPRNPENEDGLPGNFAPGGMMQTDGGFDPGADDAAQDGDDADGKGNRQNGFAPNGMQPGGGAPGDGGFDPSAANAPDGMMQPPEMGMQTDTETDADAAQSTKGLKSNGGMTITGGRITIDAQDDALHAAGDIAIGGGVIELMSGDDGVHSDALLSIRGGDVTVTRSYEGLEGWSIAMTGGDVSVTADDDGLNASGDGGMGFGRWRAQSEDGEENELCELRISGGTLAVNAQGDGVDSNGDLVIEGGTVIVNGPTNSGNGAIDSGSESGGVCSVTGGTVLALGAEGMAEGFDETSSQVSVMQTLNQTLRAGDVLRILDENGSVLIEHTALKDAQSVVFSCPALAIGQTITIEAGGASESVTLEGITNGGGFGGFGRGGQR